MKNLNKKIQAQFDKMCLTGNLFKVEVTGRQVWKMYLESFTDANDPVFRDPEKTAHDCNHCNNFIRRYGNVVALDGNMNIMSIFDVVHTDEYQNSLDNMSKLIKGSKIANVFFETFDELQSLPYEACKKTNNVFRLGTDKNHKSYSEAEAKVYGVVKPNKVYVFNHFFLDLPKDFVKINQGSIETIMAKHKSNKDVFQRAMEEIPADTLELVRDLINQGSLLDGETHLYKVEKTYKLKCAYDAVSPEIRDNWCWEASHNYELAKFKNELIGVLCSELAEGEELNKACRSWNKRVDPANYMKAVAPITDTQKKEAQKFVEENNYVESFSRRHATLDDIKVSEILHSNIGEDKIKEVSMFDNVTTKKSQHKRNEFKEVEEVSIDKFMENILPNCTSVEAFVENRHEGNFVSMTTIKEKECKDIFKWSNPYSWTYNGNLAGKSQIKEAVKSQGGKVDGVLRFSIMWAENNKDNSDLDAHCVEPNGNMIYFSDMISHNTGGNLDIDIQRPQSHSKDVVENITFPSLSRMSDGVYKMFVRQFSERGSQGFKAEIEFNDELFEYNYPTHIPNKKDIQVAEVTLKDGVFTIKHILPSTNSSKEIYGIETSNFHKVNLMCLSPNHWSDNKTGNKHYFFMLDNCKADTSLRSFHSENLNTELASHRKVLEVLGAVNMIEPVGKQLSGLGFNATVKDNLILKLGGNFKRTVRVKF